ncbi:Nn.00g058300.m01.CDS01 [Neocucurbitaria sp. VM-36]
MSNDTAWGRRLVICCDGTWQSSVSSKENVPSNITKLCRLIARIGEDKNDSSKKFHQIVYYDSGIGTGNLSTSEAKRQGGTGAGLAENVIEAYNFIVQNYESGDEIFCFGFSRGAYTARAVAGLVSDIGVIRPIDMQFFPDLYRLYMTNDEGIEFRKTKAWSWFTDGKLSKKGEEMKKKGKDVNKIGLSDLKDLAEAWEIRPHHEIALPDSRKVKVVGVFDTVGSLGIPDVVGLDLAWGRTKYGFHNVKLTEQIEHAYQALALEERRKAFRPTLWYIPKDLVDDPDRPTPELKQAWFPGVHINCGGGSDDCIGEMKGDSETTLCWMLQCISPHLTIDREAFELYLAQYKRWLFRIRYACTYHHETFADKAWSYVPKLPSIPILNPGPDELAEPRRDPPHAHADFDFSWGTGPLVDSFGGMYHLNGTQPRVPGHEDVEIYNEKAKEPKWTPLRDLGQTNEYIHPIVRHRQLVRGWDKHSPLQNGWHRDHWRGDDGKHRYWWFKKDERETCALPEWAILPDVSNKEYNFERKWYNECEKTKKTLDQLAKDTDIGPNDFLKTLDQNIEFGFDNKPQNLWP